MLRYACPQLFDVPHCPTCWSEKFETEKFSANVSSGMSVIVAPGWTPVIWTCAGPPPEEPHAANARQTPAIDATRHMSHLPVVSGSARPAAAISSPGTV